MMGIVKSMLPKPNALLVSHYGSKKILKISGWDMTRSMHAYLLFAVNSRSDPCFWYPKIPDKFLSFDQPILNLNTTNRPTQ